MKRKITLRNEREIVVIENDSMEVIVKILIDNYSIRKNRSGFNIVILYTTNYIIDCSELDEEEVQLFIEVLSKILTEREGDDAIIIYTFMKKAYYPIVVRIN